MDKKIRRTKIDWFDEEGNLKQTFNSYEHVVQIFKNEFNNNKII